MAVPCNAVCAACRHEQRGTVATMDEAGRLLANLASVVPQGLVAFAPSFAYCEQLLQRWEASGLLQQLGAKKKFFRWAALAGGARWAAPCHHVACGMCSSQCCMSCYR